MCGCVPVEVLRPCSAANTADFCVPSVRSLRRSFTYAQFHDCTGLKKNPILYFMHVLGVADTAICRSRCILYKNKKHLKNEQRNRDAAAKNRANTSGVGKGNNYYNHIYTF